MRDFWLVLAFLAAVGCGGGGGGDDGAGDGAGDAGGDGVSADGVAEAKQDGTLSDRGGADGASADAGDAQPGDGKDDGGVDAAPDLGPKCPFGCPPGYCDEATGFCLYCDENNECPLPTQWCKGDKCVETYCIPGTKSCAGATLSQTCTDDGEAWDQTQCSPGFACQGGECVQTICTPGEYTCDKGLKHQCNPNGSGYMDVPCPPGQGCFIDVCGPIQHNLLVIFDTSSSMSSIGFMDTVPCVCASCASKPFPACEDKDCPQSKLGLSKYVFNKFFEYEKLGIVNLVITHFAMQIKYPPSTKCNDMFSFGRGWYGLGSSDWMTGDNGEHVTTEGGWFDKNLHEIMAVPFPKTYDEDPVGVAKLWVNFNEEVGPTVAPCTSHAQCPGGFCAPDQGAKVCWYHTDPELRAIGNTPLGRSMFYAGEVYRKQIIPAGRTCQTDEDCKNRNYHCGGDGTCKDPFAACRSNLIVLFTDGAEEPPTMVTDFFNPRTQAKRFRYGLGCESDDDCFDGATCLGNLCQGYPHPNSGGGAYPPNTETPWRLETYSGDPIMITTHVIDMSGGEGSAANMGIADDGGGSYFKPDELDPDKLLQQLFSIIDIKQNLLDCVPQYE